METKDNNNNQQGNNEEGKIARNYEATMKKLVAVVGGEANLFPVKKVGNDVLHQIVEGLMKERKDNLEKEVKSDLLSLLDKHVALKKEIKAKEDEFKKLTETKMKEFSEAASKVFAKIDGMGELEKEYYASLKIASTEAPNAEAKE